jgi:HEAT repeat protein
MHWPALPADPALRLATLIALTLAAVTLLVLVQVLLISAWAGRERRLREAFGRTWRPQLALASIDAASRPDAPTPRGRRRLWWLMQWNRLQRQLRGDANRRLNVLIRDYRLDRHALRLLRRPGVRNRLVALEALRHLGDAAHWSQVAPLVRAGNPFVSLAAAQALVAMDAPAAMRLLLPMALERPDWGRQRVIALCRAAGREAVTPPLLDRLERADARQASKLVSLLACADPVRVAPWARHCALTDPDPRDRAAALQALGELGDPRDRALFLQAFADEDASVRLAAVAALRRQAHSGDADALVGLLADRSWWVRRQAADTLVALPRVSGAQLQARLPGIADRYGREALARALAERMQRQDAP